MEFTFYPLVVIIQYVPGYIFSDSVGRQLSLEQSEALIPDGPGGKSAVSSCVSFIPMLLLWILFCNPSFVQH